MRSIRFAILVLVIVAIGLASTAYAEKRVALVIGNGQYGKNIGPLVNPPNDARLVAGTLRDLDFEVIETIDGSFKGMKKAIRDFGKRLDAAGKDGVGLFYYAGHGVQVKGANFMIPVDANIETEGDVDLEAINANAVLSMMEFSGARLSFVILDACRDNPFARGFRSATRGLAKLEAPRGSLIAYATSPGNVAADGKGRNSPYTEALVRGMKSGRPVERMFREVRNAVMAATNDKQTPWESSSLTGGDFYFKEGPRTQATAATPVPSVAVDKEAMFWQSIQDSDNPALYQAYLDQYPKGSFAALAKAKIEISRQRKTAAVSVPARPKSPYRVVEALNKPFVVAKNGAALAEPSAVAKEVLALTKGEEVAVIDLVGANGFKWYRIAMAGGRSAYAFFTLLEEKKVKPASGVQPAVGGPLTPGKSFRDCADCPEMVVIPPGSFRMGSTALGKNDGKPVRTVNIGYAFTVGKYEVSRGEFEAFVNASGHRTSGACWYFAKKQLWESASKTWRTPGYNQTDRDPVACVNWDDAQAYTAWLSRKTGQRYRLLSESEWEYTARAGTTSNYAFGHALTPSQANFGENVGKTTPVGRYPANNFGVHDMHGNVWEWTQDCYQDSYGGAPSDGSAIEKNDYCSRVYRGGSWYNASWRLTSSTRNSHGAYYRYNLLGFRVARDLSAAQGQGVSAKEIGRAHV